MRGPRGPRAHHSVARGAGEHPPIRVPNPRVRAILTGLSCTDFPTWEALYKQLGNMRLLRRESILRSTGNIDTPTQEILIQAPLVSSPKEDQFDAVVVDQVSTLTQTWSHQNTVSAPCSLVSSKAPRPTQRPSGLSTSSGRVGACGRGPKGYKPPSQAFFP